MEMLVMVGSGTRIEGGRKEKTHAALYSMRRKGEKRAWVLERSKLVLRLRTIGMLRTE